MSICPTWRNRFSLLRLAYAGKLPGWAKPAPGRAISFRYPPPVGNIEVVLRNNNGSDFFIFSEVFDHRYYDFDLAFLPKTILDLGANAGYTAIFLGRKYAQAEIACVEPMPQNIAVLRQNLSLNRISATIIEAAATVKDGVIKMETNAHDYGHKVAENPGSCSAALVSCQGISVPSLMKRLGWERIGLVKIDIEGYERFLLKKECGWLKLVDAICIECHPGYGEDNLLAMAREHGFAEPQRLCGLWLIPRPFPVSKARDS